LIQCPLSSFFPILSSVQVIQSDLHRYLTNILPRAFSPLTLGSSRPPSSCLFRHVRINSLRLVLLLKRPKRAAALQADTNLQKADATADLDEDTGAESEEEVEDDSEGGEPEQKKAKTAGGGSTVTKSFANGKGRKGGKGKAKTKKAKAPVKVGWKGLKSMAKGIDTFPVEVWDM
jgi:hypothetical protein